MVDLGTRRIACQTSRGLALIGTIEPRDQQPHPPTSAGSLGVLDRFRYDPATKRLHWDKWPGPPAALALDLRPSLELARALEVDSAHPPPPS